MASRPSDAPGGGPTGPRWHPRGGASGRWRRKVSGRAAGGGGGSAARRPGRDARAAPAYASPMTPPAAPTIASFASDVLTIEVDGHVATLWLDRPDKRNAMGPAFWSDLPRAMAAIGREPEVRAVVVAARGPHFTVGLDLVAMAGLTGPAKTGDGAPPSMAARARSARAEIRPPAGLGDLGGRLPSPGHRRRARLLHRRWGRPDRRLRHPTGQRRRRHSRSARPRWPSSPTSAACSGCPASSARATWPNWPSPARTSPRRGPRPSGWSTTSAPTPTRARPTPGRWPPRSPPTRRWPCRAPRRCWPPATGRSVAEGLDYVATWNAGFLASDDLVEAMAAFMEKRPAVFTGR